MVPSGGGVGGPQAGKLTSDAGLEDQWIDIKIAQIDSGFRTLRSQFQRFSIGLAAITLFLLIAAVFFPIAGLQVRQIVVIVGLYSVVLWVVFYLVLGSRQRSLEAEQEALVVKKRISSQLLNLPGSPTAAPTYFDRLVQINVENLAEYYTLVKVHTENSFRTSIAAGIAGFVFIVTGLIIGFGSTTSTQVAAYIATSSGIVTEFIAGVFFYLYNRTVRQLKEYHDSLLAVQNILLSFKIVDDIQDKAEKVKMTGQMLGYLIGSPAAPIADALPRLLKRIPAGSNESGSKDAKRKKNTP